MNLLERVAIDPEIRSGKACIRGTRITVFDVLEYLAGGMSIPDVLADFPSLSEDDIRACFAFAAARERGLSVSRGPGSSLVVRLLRNAQLLRITP